jgi:uncharacterized repeat protein (TIGR03803 family)
LILIFKDWNKLISEEAVYSVEFFQDSGNSGTLKNTLLSLLKYVELKTMKIPVFFLIPVLILLIIGHQVFSQEIWGTTKYGGKYGKGVIFKMDENASNQEVVFSFEETGIPEGKMTEYDEGIFYGMTYSGGKFNYGTIYRFSIVDGGFINVLDLNGEETGKNGAGSFLLAQNGKMYGMTVNGGIYDLGILFEFDPHTETFLKLHDFDGENNGSEPLGSLTETAGGSIYGMTSMGGEYDAGVIFKFEPLTGELTKILDFNGDSMGSNPMGSLTHCSDGKLYGMTRWGGINNHGVIFSLTVDNEEFIPLFEFEGEVTGRNPHGSLLEADNGKLYGLTPFGGTYNKGVIFEFDKSVNLYEKKHDFTGWLHSYGSLKQASNGKIYGVVSEQYFAGAIMFEYDLQQESVQEVYYSPDGLRGYIGSTESMMEASDGKLYFWGSETVYPEKDIWLFEFDPEENSIIRHIRRSSNYDGGFPHGNLVQAVNGSFYAQTSKGGKYDLGVIFEFNPFTGVYRKIIDFDGDKKGAIPKGSLITADNHKIYGMTSKGGETDKGVLFEFDPLTEIFVKLIDFNGEEKGDQPNGSLVQASNGNIYGMTTFGGIHNYGVVFELVLETGTFYKLIDFNNIDNGKEPHGALLEASDGYLYGTSGKLFKIDINSGVFSVIPGIDVRARELMQASNQKIYGSGLGVFAYDPTNDTFEKVNTYTIGAIGKLYEASDDKLWGLDYGEIHVHGTEDYGSIFEIDLGTKNSVRLVNFDGKNGANPDNSGLIQYRSYTPPVASCKSDFTLYLDESGQAMLHSQDIDDESSGNGLELLVSKSFFTCEDVGYNNVILTVTDEQGITASCETVVSVTDTISPAAICRDMEIYLDAGGYAVIIAEEIDNGSSDVCGIQLMTLDITTLSEENIGENIVVLTVTDNNGNVSTCSSTVTVHDQPPSSAVCQDLEVFLDSNGTVGIDAAEVYGSTDTDEIKSISLDVSTFTCEDVGENTVVLTVTYNNDNVSTCSATVTVMDNTAPEALCRNIEITLDENGYAAIDAAEIDNGSINACGIQSMSLDVTSFSCENIGDNPVELTVTGNNGNSSTCLGTVTVVDNIAPETICISDVSLYINPYEESFMVDGDNLDAIVADNCGIESLIYTINGIESASGTSLAGVQLKAGIHELVWLATDIAGNESFCNSVIHIEKRPTALIFVSNEIHQNQGFVEVKVMLIDDLLVNGVAGKKLAFTIDDFTEIVETDENGVATLKFSPEELSGNYSVTASFEEDATYTGSILKSEIVTSLADMSVIHFKVFPNPFANRLQIEFTAPETAHARIDLFDSSGRLVKTIFNQQVEAGMFYKTEYRPETGSNAGSFYFYQMISGNRIYNGKIIRSP